MNFRQYILLSLVSLFCIVCDATAPTNDPLPSWNNGKIKSSIIEFVQNVTNPQSSMYVPPENRIATFDNDGTLWVEKPMYTQAVFAVDRIKNLATLHPEWKDQEPYKSILADDYSKLTMQDIEGAIALTHSGMTVESFQEIEKQWLATTKDKHFDRYYTDLIYEPMLEVINYLKANQFKIYIVSGGGQQFIRAYSDKTYGIPSEQVIGTAGKTKYVYRQDKPELIKTPDVLFVDDKDGKPEAINLFIGKKPIIAFGNSDGDKQMLEWTQSGSKNNLMFLVHHDDASREYAYDEKSKVGTFSEYLFQAAKENNWQIISMRDDWKQIFPPLTPPPSYIKAPTAKPVSQLPQPEVTKPVKVKHLKKTKIKTEAFQEHIVIHRAPPPVMHAYDVNY